MPCDRKRKLEFNIVESINIEILIADEKWLISRVYRPQTIDEKTFNEDFIKTCDQITTAYDNFMFIGDLNYDMLVSDKSSPLQNVCDIFDLTNLVKGPTCYTKNSNPSLNDVILTNMPNNCMNVTNCNCGINDVHNLITVQIKGSIIQRKNELNSYRSLKHFSEQEFLKDLQGFNFNFNNISKHEDIDEAYSNFENSIIKTLDKHAPIKRRKHIPQPAPFISKQLRQAIYKKRMLHNTFIIPSPTKLRRDIVTLPFVLPSVRHILVNTLGSTSFNGI